MIDIVFSKVINDELSVEVYDCEAKDDLHIPGGRFLAINYTDQNKCQAALELGIEDGMLLYKALKEFYNGNT